MPSSQRGSPGNFCRRAGSSEKGQLAKNCPTQVTALCEPPAEAARSNYVLLRLELQLRWLATQAAGQPEQVEAADHQPGAAEHDRQSVEAGHQPQRRQQADQRAEQVEQ